MTRWPWWCAILEYAMNELTSELSDDYAAALRSYLSTDGEEALHAAYELGRKAVAAGLGVLGMAKIHQQASVALLPQLGKNQHHVQAVENFFMEALSPFEAQHRGFHEANARLRVLNEALEKRAAELAATNRELSHEITRRKASEEMWKRYESIVNTSREFLTLIASNYRYEAANDAYCQAHCKPREEIIGFSVEDIWGRATFRNIIKAHLDQCFKGEEVHYQAWLDMAGPGRRYFDVSYYPYHQRATVTHAIVVTRDVTDRLRAERALRDSEEQFRTVMQSAIDAIILTDSRGTIITCNQAARTMFGRPREEMVGHPVTVLVPERYRHSQASGIKRVRGADPEAWECRYRSGTSTETGARTFLLWHHPRYHRAKARRRGDPAPANGCPLGQRRGGFARRPGCRGEQSVRCGRVDHRTGLGSASGRFAPGMQPGVALPR